MKKDKDLDKDKKIQEFEMKLKEAEESKLRALADYQNLQKRIEKEKEELSYILVASLLHQIIDIKEDLERFLESEKNDGVKAILDKLNNILIERGVVEIEIKKGDDMNPEVMEAITSIESQDEKMKGKVMDIVQKGYKLNTEKIIRTAKVVIGK